MHEVASQRISRQQVQPTRPVPDIAADLIAGFSRQPRSLPPKYFYDAVGSRLFDQICDTPEYYLTRTEDALLAQYASSVIAEVVPDSIVEIGSGTSRKTRHLINACAEHGCHANYAPMDVCHEILTEASEGLARDYDWINILALSGDYNAGLAHLPDTGDVRLFLFLGSSIGNFEDDEAVDFLCDLRASMRPSDRILIGMDRCKAPAILYAAYNDAAGLTARFNLNVLSVLNRELHAGFRLDWFHHHAAYNAEKRRMEMHLIANKAHEVPLRDLDMVVPFAEGDVIFTESSRKYTRCDIDALLEAGGFATMRHMESGNRYYSLVLAAPVA